MITSLRQSGLAAAILGAGCAALSAAAGAQSLSLTYRLDPVNVPKSARSAPPVDRCSGLSWAASLAAGCSTPTAERANAVRVVVASPSTVEHVRYARPAEGGETYTGADPQARRYELPTLGSPRADGRLVRMAGGRDDYIANSRAVDVNFRFGSKYRMRSGEDGLEVYKFSDMTTESRSQSGGLKNVGVELTFPFQ